ncbi:MAG: hypothetical protein AB4426_27270 [Xenococcaceae cyanobacterium]
MKFKTSLAIALTLVWATGVGAVVLADKAKASSEDLSRVTPQDNSGEIDKVLTPGQNCSPWPDC